MHPEVGEWRLESRSIPGAHSLRKGARESSLGWQGGQSIVPVNLYLPPPSTRSQLCP